MVCLEEGGSLQEIVRCTNTAMVTGLDKSIDEIKYKWFIRYHNCKCNVHNGEGTTAMTASGQSEGNTTRRRTN